MLTTSGKVRLAYVVSHPIQYQAPLLRRIAQEPDIDLTVLFGSDFSVRGYKDEGFGVEVEWDTPLLEGYRYEFLPRLRDTGGVSPVSPISRGIYKRLRTADGSPAFDALWVHGYASINALQAILAANALGIPVLLRAESWLADRSRSPLKLLAKSLFFSDLRPLISATLPIGTANARYWRHYLGHAMPQFLMPYAVDNAFFACRAQEAAAGEEQLRLELGIETGHPVILFASKLQQRKHCDHLVEAYAALLRDHDSSGYKPYLVIVGDGEERANLEARCRDLGLTNVRFAGFQNQSVLPRYFHLADVFVLPSRHEPWGLIVNEAMAAGCPVIVSSDVGSGPDLVTNGVEGYSYPVGDILALTSALSRVLASPETAAAMGEAAQRRIAGWSFEEDVQGLRHALAYTTRKLRA
ncbi:glycosyltransferase family 4 protein [Granulicella mallensis]|uniref:Glycosyltransferase involved in cell wall biosynthesis n=1 Tax=Granulicella mallensis TaxID=940614 RepID=A0A7W7ZVE7_9BACT|nr:glycosyltransferase family 4 protein [Granulicella mallensis]MBB5066507.1 glycosyltransferase involved in cell wall biosynthesis [Granulicella mallensis]